MPEIKRTMTPKEEAAWLEEQERMIRERSEPPSVMTTHGYPPEPDLLSEQHLWNRIA